jgi:hypothetical protein
MNGNRYYGVRVEGAKYGVGFGSALAIAISYTANHSILWAIIDGIGLAVCDLLRTVSVIITASIARTSASYAARGSNTATLARCWAHEGPMPPQRTSFWK